MSIIMESPNSHTVGPVEPFGPVEPVRPVGPVGPAIQVVFLDKTIGFKNSDLTVDNLGAVFGIDSVSYLEDSKGERFFPMLDNHFEDITSKKVYLRQEIPKIPQVKIFPTESRFVYNTGSWGQAFTELMIGYSPANGNMRIAAIQFQDLTTIDKKKSISKAYLRLIGTNQESCDAVEIFVHRVDEAWSSITTWDQLPIYRRDPYCSAIVKNAFQEPYYWDITGIVVDWIKNDFPNFGIVMKVVSDFEISSAKHFHNSNQAKKPCLLIYYEEEEEEEVD